MNKFIFLTFSISIFFFNANAQIVNIENQRLKTKKEGFSGNVDIKFNLTYATKQLFQIGGQAKVAYAKKKHYLMLLTDYFLVTSSFNEDFINKGFEHIRYNYTLKDSGKVVFETFHQGQFNKIQKINKRLLLGAGLRFLIIDQKNYQLNLGSSLMGEYEEMELTIPLISQDILSSNYISFDGQFNETFGMNFITYFQPKFIDFGNYRIASETQLRFKINKFLSLKVIYKLNHDSRNLPDVRKTYYSLSNTLSFKF
jgi:putative salt-induced outer membrane protein YdiY